MKISKNKHMRFFSHVTKITQPKNWVPRPKGVPCSPSTDTHTDRQKVTLRASFQGFRIFSSTYHQGSAQLYLIIFIDTLNENGLR